MVGGSGAARTCRAAFLPPRGARRGNPSSCDRFFSPDRFLLGSDPPFLSSLFNYFFEFEWIFSGRYDRI